MTHDIIVNGIGPPTKYIQLNVISDVTYLIKHMFMHISLHFKWWDQVILPFGNLI